MSSTRSLPEPKVLVDGLAYVESPRWHDGRLWFAHWGTGEIVAVDTDGQSEVVGHGRPSQRSGTGPQPRLVHRRATRGETGKIGIGAGLGEDLGVVGSDSPNAIHAAFDLD